MDRMNRIKTERTALCRKFFLSCLSCPSLLISFPFSSWRSLEGRLLLRRIICCLVLTTCCCGALPAPVGAQVVELPQPPRWQKSDETDTVRVETDLVDLNVSVFAR